MSDPSRLLQDMRFDDLVEPSGRLTEQGRKAVALVSQAFQSRGSHDDNTGLSCREDLRGHDCCYMCNGMEELIRTVMGGFDFKEDALRLSRYAVRGMTDDERIQFAKDMLNGYCILCGRSLGGGKCYCAPGYDE